MAKDKEKITKAKIKLSPADVPDEAVSDSAMPEPETKEYKRVLELTDLFKKLVLKTASKLPYKTVMTDDDGNTLKLVDLVKIAESQKEMEVPVMDRLISYMVNLPFDSVREFMSYIDDKSKQPQLWSIKMV